MQHFDYLKFFPKLKKFQKVKYLLLGENPNPNPNPEKKYIITAWFTHYFVFLKTYNYENLSILNKISFFCISNHEENSNLNKFYWAKKYKMFQKKVADVNFSRFVPVHRLKIALGTEEQKYGGGKAAKNAL